MKGKEGFSMLRKTDKKLHLSPEVEHEVKRRKLKGEKVSDRPEIKIENWLKVIEKTHTGHREDPRVLDRIKKYYHKKYVIKEENIPESYFVTQKRIARERGHGDIEITNEMRHQMSESVIEDQKYSLDVWTKYFISPDSDSYPMWAKYWAYTNMLKLSNYNKEKHSFNKRTKQTTSPFVELNREALAYVVDIVEKKLNKEKIADLENNPELQKILQNESFNKLYAYAIEKVTPTEESELSNTDGEWIFYKQGTDHTELVKSLEGYGTGWCTAVEGTAKIQLSNGDFHTYYSYNKDREPAIPRVAIRMKGDKIAEIRGIAHQQNLDKYISESNVVSEKMKEFKEEGEEYKKKDADMKHLTEIDNKHQNGEKLDKEDLRFLYEIDSKIQGFGYSNDPRIEKILKDRNKRKDLSTATGYNEDEISLTTKEFLDSEKRIKYHFGYLYLESFISIKDFVLPEGLNGDLNLGSLQSAEGLVLPEGFNGDLVLYSLTSAEGLVLPEGFNGDLNLRNITSAEGLILPKKFNKYLDLSGLTSAEGLVLPEGFSGDLDLYSLISAEGLVLPEGYNGYINLYNLTSAEKQKLKEKYPNINII